MWWVGQETSLGEECLRWEGVEQSWEAGKLEEEQWAPAPN